MVPLWLRSPGFIDVILGVIALELILRAGWRRSRGQPMRPGGLVLSVLPGVCMLMALRVAFGGGEPLWIGLWLAASFPAHLADLWCRKP